jgi:hypothetical protein
MINTRRYTATHLMSFFQNAECVKYQTDSDVNCHYYHHDEDGAQVMIASSKKRKYLAIIFAGTDDVRTSLTDADILMKPFGDANFTLPDPRVRVHAGFENTVFSKNLFGNVTDRFEELRLKLPRSYRLFTTGHSLGAAASVLTAAGLTLRHEQNLLAKNRPVVTSINFGCPRIGNYAWREFIHENPFMNNLAIWRMVLGWDLVPRLPEFFQHAGHTVQLQQHHSLGYWQDNTTLPTADAYYHHYGDPDHGFAGVPFGWSSKPYFWVPGALMSHNICRYWAFLHNWTNSPDPHHRDAWVKSFVRVEPDSDDKPPAVDDDFYVDPPDDDFEVETAET